MTSPDYRYAPAKVVLPHNRTCPYCGQTLPVAEGTKEHVIGRRFVPRGTLQGSWNLLLRVCIACNRRKGELEDRVSAVSMHPPFVTADGRDSTLAKEAARKRLGTLGPRADRGLQRINVEGELMPGVRVKVGLVGPPSTHEDDIFQLAWSQVSAFFYLLTYDAAKEAGVALPGGFRGVQWATRTDWGNSRHREFMRQTANWNHRFWLDAATGFFKAVIRRHPSEQCWAWALEWNATFRVVGFFGNPAVVDDIVASIPKLELTPIGRSADGEVLSRPETPLDVEDDSLFLPPKAVAQNSPSDAGNDPASPKIPHLPLD
jgi:hypothetical protein